MLPFSLQSNHVTIRQAVSRKKSKYITRIESPKKAKKNECGICSKNQKKWILSVCLEKGFVWLWVDAKTKHGGIRLLARLCPFFAFSSTAVVDVVVLDRCTWIGRYDKIGMDKGIQKYRATQLSSPSFSTIHIHEARDGCPEHCSKQMNRKQADNSSEVKAPPTKQPIHPPKPTKQQSIGYVRRGLLHKKGDKALWGRAVKC